MELLKGEKSFLSLLLYFLASLIAIIVIPGFDRILNPYSQSPTYISTVGVSLIMIILMGTLLNFGIKSKERLNKQFLVYTLFFTSLIVIAKFSFSPISLYFVNSQEAFESTFTNTEFFSMLFSATGIAALYLFVFGILYLLAKRKFYKNTSTSAEKIESKLTLKKVLADIVLAILIFFIVMAGLVTPVIFFPAMFSLTYLSYVFSSFVGIFIALSLVGAIYFARMSFLTLEEQAIKARDVTILTSFFWFGTFLILAYHALWVIFMLVLGSVWPFKTYSSK